MKTEDLLRLRKLAEKATQGKYYYTEDDSKSTVDGFCYGVVSSEEESDSHSYICHGASVENGNYISSLSPSVLIPLLDELIEARKVVGRLNDCCHLLDSALRRVLEQPFNGNWDAQAVYIQHMLHEARNWKPAHQAKFNVGVE